MGYLKKITVFCGTHFGKNSIYREKVSQLAEVLVKEDITVIYGGATVGLMGLIADEMLKREGKVIGIIPQSLVEVERVHKGLTELQVVASMHERKALMSSLGEGFILLPGGTGSLEEFLEMITWRQLNYHKKPLGILNIGGYYDKLISLLNDMVEEGFFSENYFKLIHVDESPQELLHKMQKQINP